MVDRVRAVHSGLLTYDMHYSVLLDLEYFGPGSNHLWNEKQGDDKGAALPHLNFPHLVDPPEEIIFAVGVDPPDGDS